MANSWKDYRKRARELMLQPEPAAAFELLNVAADKRGECPGCNQAVGGYEHERLTHSRTCKPLAVWAGFMRFQKFDSLPADCIAPAWSAEINGERTVTNLGSAFLWSGPFPVPPVGARVVVAMNGLGPGKVMGYFAEHGWLGLRVKLSKPPDWLKKQCKDRKEPVGESMVFGAELATE